MLRVDGERAEERDNATTSDAQGDIAPVDVAAYETWRAARDVDEVIFRFEAALGDVPAALYRLRRFVRAIAQRRQDADR
jgi:hypothetical protein